MALLCLALAEPTLATARACRALEAELASGGGRAGGSSSQFKKYDRAVDAQREQLSLARSRARRAGCGFALLSRTPEMCGPLAAQIERMQSNLAALERKRDQLGGGAKRSRATILAALEANGCRREAVTANRPRSEENGEGDFFSRLFGTGTRETEAPEAPEAERRPRKLATLETRERSSNVTRVLNPNGETTVFGPVGQFSTMCVRACDGYYFPISPNSSAADFERDQKNCETTCPGTEVQLYYRPTGDEATDTMMSVAGGDTYASLPTAYLYRDVTKPQPPACGCKGVAANPNFSIVGGEPAGDAVSMEPALPEARPDPALDPETLANQDGKLDVDTIRRILQPAAGAKVPAPPSGERKVRVVGPVFLPDPEGAIDLKAPARTEAQ